MILHDLGDEALGTKIRDDLSEQAVEEMVAKVLRSIAQYGLWQEDLKLNNFHMFGDRIMSIDLEQVEPIQFEPAELESNIEADSRSIARKWTRRQKIVKENEQRDEARRLWDSQGRQPSRRPPFSFSAQ